MEDLTILLCLIHGDPFRNAFEIEIPSTRQVGRLKNLIQAQVSRGTVRDLILWGVNIPFGDDTALESVYHSLDENGDSPIVRELLVGDTIASALPNPVSGHVNVIAVVSGISTDFHNYMYFPNPTNTCGVEKRGVKRALDDEHDRKLDQILEQLNALHEEKKISISISRILRTQFQEILSENDLRRLSVTPTIDPTSKHVVEFTSDNSKEEMNSLAYLSWLETNIAIPSTMTFKLVSSNSNFLSTDLASSRYRLKGTLDTIIVDKAYVEDSNTAAGVRIGMEMKKTVTEKDCIQAIIELLAADIFSNFPVVMVLTDLKQYWQFFWFSRGNAVRNVVSCKLDLRRAVTMLEGILRMDPTEQGPCSNRCTFQEAIGNQSGPRPGSCSGGVSGANISMDAATGSPYNPQKMNHGQVMNIARDCSIGSLPKPQKMDRNQILQGDDVADMRDVYDIMDPVDIQQWELKKTVEWAMRTPALQSISGYEGWMSMYC